MISSAKQLTDDDIKEAAAYFSAQKPRRNVRINETDTVSRPVVASWTWIDPRSGVREPIGRRAVEVPEHLEEFELRDSHATFIAYVPPGSLKRGEALVTGTLPAVVPACTSCHGAELKGMALAPPIAGRSVSYALRQHYEIKSGVRTGANSAQMKPVLEKLEGDDLLAIVAYLASLPPN